MVFPYWRDNPYLNMLYVGARAEGWRVVEARDATRLSEELAALVRGDVFHLHWTSPLVQDKAAPADARRALDEFKGVIQGARSRGVRILWTVHNTTSHDARNLDLEIELAEFLAESATAIIQLNTHTADAVEDLYALPARKLVTLRHASYAGIYAEAPRQELARELLGVPTASPTVAFIGQMRAYKGLSTLFAAIRRLARSVPDLTLLLAGKSDATETARIDRELPRGVRVIQEHRYVPVSELGTWFAAADVLVFPYEKILNSGSMLVSATFGRPCILPAEPHVVAEYETQEWVRFFQPGEGKATSLAATLAKTLADPIMPRASALAFAREYTMRDMAWDYVSILMGLEDDD
ncbi:glycosyltransferase [Microbacterium sp.]|uniref:glycosyltransferase n=1 Tax=Microbacterium sp. TaxID=51671 RepID=UPI003A90E04A